MITAYPHLDMLNLKIFAKRCWKRNVIFVPNMNSITVYFIFLCFLAKKEKNSKMSRKKNIENKVNEYRIHILDKYKNPFPTFFSENL